MSADVTDATTLASSVGRSELLGRFSPRPAATSWPTTQARRAVMMKRLLSPPFALENRLSQQTRRLGVLAVVNWLQARPGETWQQRWQSSGAENVADWRSL